MKILLLGIGVANLGCARLLDKYYIEYDMKQINEIESLDEYDLIVKSPGISLSDEIFLDYKGRVISDLELVYILEPKFIICVTGSNGKTTVVSMLNHILSKKYKTIACGNIGYSFADAVLENPDAKIFIVEASSFQLEAIDKFAPNISVLLNASVCHLDHHLNLNNYVSAKKNIYKNQSFNDYTIYNMDDKLLNRIACYSNKISFTADSTLGNIYVLDRYIYYRSKRIYHLNDEEFKRKHLISNYCAVFAVMHALKFSFKKAKKLIKSFKTPKFRLEKIDDYIYNDAKSTNCASTEAAILSIGDTHLICGGYDRGMDINLSLEALYKIKATYAYGECKDKLYDYFSKHNIICYKFDTLKEAFLYCCNRRGEKENILYSPMLASFDQYKSYNERGNEFNRLYKEKKSF